MSKMVQIRNMPDNLHRAFKVRAAAEGLSLSDYLLRELERAAKYPSVEEFRRRLAGRRQVSQPDTTVGWVREERDTR
jgi:plasmid stability protein